MHPTVASDAAEYLSDPLDADWYASSTLIGTI
jgi:hypothetical protein